MSSCIVSETLVSIALVCKGVILCNKAAVNPPCFLIILLWRSCIELVVPFFFSLSAAWCATTNVVWGQSPTRNHFPQQQGHEMIGVVHLHGEAQTDQNTVIPDWEIQLL